MGGCEGGFICCIGGCGEWVLLGRLVGCGDMVTALAHLDAKWQDLWIPYTQSRSS